MPFTLTPRGKFYYETWGKAGPVVLLLHGLTSRCFTWKETAQWLSSEGFRVWAPDMRGHGKSDKPERGYTPEDHAQDLAAILNELLIPQAHIVGHSTGGRNALVFAGLYPGMALSLTIIDQTLMPAPDRWKKHVEEFARYPAPFDDEPSLDRFLEILFPGRERKIAHEKTQFEKKENGKWDWVFSIPAIVETQKWGRAVDYSPWLEKVQCPVLFMKGLESAYVSPEEADKIEKLIRQGRLVGVEKAGHGVFVDNPDGFRRVLLGFLGKTQESGSVSV